MNLLPRPNFLRNCIEDGRYISLLSSCEPSQQRCTMNSMSKNSCPVLEINNGQDFLEIQCNVVDIFLIQCNAQICS